MLVTPLVPGTLMGAILPFVDRTDDWWAGVLLIPIAYEFSLLLTVVIGLPVFLVLRQMNWLRWWVAPVVGLPIGFRVGYSLFKGQPIWNPAVLGVIGSLTAFAFWLIWHKLTTVRTLDPDPS